MINEPKHDDGRSKIHHTCQNKQTETPPPDAFPQAIFIAHHGSQSYITDAVLLPSVTDDEAKGYVDLRASVSMFNRLLSSAHSLSSGVTRAFSITTHVSSYVNTSSAEYRKLSLEKLQVAKARIEALNPETRNSKVVLPFAAVAGSSSGVVNCGSSDVVSTSGSRNNLIILDTNTHGNKSSQEPVWPLFVSSEDANASTIRPPARAERESADLDKEAAGSWDLAPITTRTGIHSGAAERTSFLASLTTHPRNISTANLTTKSSTCPQVTAGASSHQLNTKTPPASTSANPSVRVESGTPGLCKERRNSEDLYIPLRSITFTTQPTFRGESETRGLCEGTGGAEDILSRPIPGLSSRSTTRSTFHAKSETPVLYRDLYKEPGAPKDLPSSTTTTESTFHAKSEPLIVEFKGPASSIKLLPLATTTETSLGWQTRGSALPLSTSHSRKTSTTTGTTNTNTWSTIPTMSAPPPPQDNVTPSGMMALPAPSKRKGLNFAAGRKKGAPSMTADLFPATTALKPEPAPEATSAVPVAPMFAPSLETVKEPTPGPSVVVPAAPAAEQNEGLRPSSVGKEKSDEVLSSSTAEDVLVKKKAEGDVVMKDAGIGGEGSGGGVQASPRQAPSASQIKPFASGKDAVTPKKKPAAKRASPQKKGKNSPTKVNTGQGSSDAMQGVEAHLNRDIDLKQSSRLSQAAIQEEFEAKKKEIRRLQKNAADKAIREEKASMERLLKEEEERGKAAAAEKRALQLQKDNEEGAKRAADLREQAEALRKQQIAEGNLKRAEADKEAARVAAVKEADEKRKMDRLKAKKEQVKIMAQSMTPKKRSAAEAMTSGASRSESALDSSTEIDDLFNDRMIIDSSKKDNGKGKAPMNPETPVSNKKRKTENGAVDTSATMPVTPSPAGRGAGAITTSKPKKVVNLSSALTKQPEAGPSSAIIGNFNSEPVQMGVFLNALTSQTSSISDIVVESANISQNQVELLQARLDETNEALNDLRQHVDESLSNFKLDILRAIRDGFRGKSDASLDSTTRALAVQVPPAPKPAQQQLLPPQPPVKRKPGRPPKWSKPGAPANLANLSAQRIQKAIQGASGAGSSVLNSQQLSDRTVKNKKQAIATRSRYMREGHTKNNTLDGHMRRSPGQIEADVDRKMVRISR